VANDGYTCKSWSVRPHILLSFSLQGTPGDDVADKLIGAEYIPNGHDTYLSKDSVSLAHLK